jgi:hypothetical protein
MSIVSSEVVYEEPNGPTTEVLYRFTWHTGEETTVQKQISGGVDAQQDMLSMIPLLETEKAQQEVDIAIGAAESGDAVNTSPEHQTLAEFDKRFIGRAMTIRSLDSFWHIYDGFWRDFELRAGNNKPQRAAYLNTDTGTFDGIDKRFNDMASITTLIQDERGRVWDSTPEEWQ